LLTGGRYSEVIYIVKVQYGTSKWWLFKAGGRYSEVVASSGLTVHLNPEVTLFSLKDRKKLSFAFVIFPLL